MLKNRLSVLSAFGFLFGCFLLSPQPVGAQKNSVVQVHADKNSGYGVACGGQDLIVTALHVVAGKSTIQVVWQGKSSYAQIEKIYKLSDLALLRLKTSLGIPQLTLYSGEPPWDENINFWEVPAGSTLMSQKTTIVEERSSLAKISPRVANNPAGLSKALCMDGGQYYPGMATEVINFKEPNIRKAHSGSPLTYEGKILGMVDGGAKLVDGKACVWAISASDFNKLFTQGSAPPGSMQSCGAPGIGNNYMYSGMRSDNPMLSSEEAEKARQFENPMNFTSSNGSLLELNHDYRMSFQEVYETLFQDEQKDLQDIFKAEQSITLRDLLQMPVDLYIEEMTGISVMIPSECTLSRSSDNFGTLISTTSPGGLVTMSVYISPNVSMDEGMDALNEFKSMMENIGQPMQPNDDDIDDFRDDPYTPYYSEYIEHTISDASGFIQSEFFADLMINDGDFLAVTVSVSDWNQLEMNSNERLFLYLMETCALLSDFTIY